MKPSDASRSHDNDSMSNVVRLDYIHTTHIQKHTFFSDCKVIQIKYLLKRVCNFRRRQSLFTL